MNSTSTKSLGTFLGVYIPTILTILGVIMYLRLGWIVGNLGLLKTILIIVIANAITLITTLSFSSMATNMKVGVGGAYFIISRSLGLGIGAAIGIPLFLSQTVSITLYAFGLAESFRIVAPNLPLQPATIAIILIVSGLSIYGAKVALKTQIPLLILVGISLIALAAGAFLITRPEHIIIPLPTELNFWAGFAIFFPAVTGVMAGLSLSGDLKNPEKSIPLGSISAMITGFLIYLLIPIILSMAATADELKAFSLIWVLIAPAGIFLILPGLWGAILSSAVGSVLGAPRTLQAIILDQVQNPKIKSIISGKTALSCALIFSMLIALTVVYLGGLNAVAQVVSMFFLTVYGTVNIAAGLESLSGDPSWRPRFRIPWYLNIACGLACLWVMFLISPIASIAALLIELLLWMFFTRREQKATWGDARRGLYESLLRWVLVRLSKRSMSARNWRPHVIVFVDDPYRRLDLIRFGSWFSQGRGIVTVCELIVGNVLNAKVEIDTRLEKLKNVMAKEDLVVFPEVDVVENIVQGIVDVAQANGIAGFSSNTILFGWPKSEDRLVEFLTTIRKLELLKKSVIIGKINPQHLYAPQKTSAEIHIWWGGLRQNGDLMLLLAFLLTRNSEWRNCKLKILSAASNDFAQGNTIRYLKKLLADIRIEAELDIFIKPQDSAISDLIQEKSSKASTVFLGLAIPEEGKESSYINRIEQMTQNLEVVFFVKNSSLYIGQLLKEDESEPGSSSVTSFPKTQQ